MTSDWRSNLMHRHARLFAAIGDDVRTTPGYPSCHDGWRELLETAVQRISAAVGLNDTFAIVQVKEKLGGLRIYWSGRLDAMTKSNVEEAIDLAEARADCTCERCGAEGSLRVSGGWLATACDDHAMGEAEYISPGLEQLHVVRELVDGRLRITKCRRYMRNFDEFVEIDPVSVGIED